jgi:DNA repair protein SbcD/Mre11
LKIIHTADWHIGKILHQLDIQEDHDLFFDWLKEYIESTNADVLLVSGDIFDHSNPTNEAQKLYFKAITKLQKTGVQIILTGGNHDSITRLNSSEDILRLVGIDIVGGVPENFDEQIIPLKNRHGDIEAICGAVPFLRDKDIKEFVSGESIDDRVKAIRSGIFKHYEKLKNRINDLYGERLPIIAMGHLYMQGPTTSPEEREIQLGNQAGLDVNAYNGMFDYFALGHIHIPYRFGDVIRYSGSPIPLDFSEYIHDKIVIEVNIAEGAIKSKSVIIPKFRSYATLSGDWDTVREEIINFKSEAKLQSVFNLKINSKVEEMAIIDQEISEMKIRYNILQRKFNNLSQKNNYFIDTEKIKNEIRDLDPNEVFRKKMESVGVTDDQVEMLTLAHQEILNMVNQGE